MGEIKYSKIDWEWHQRLVDNENHYARELYENKRPYCYIEGTGEKPSVSIDFDQEFVSGKGDDNITAFSLTNRQVSHLMYLQGVVTASEYVSPEQQVEWAWNNQELCAFVDWAEANYQHADRCYREAVELFTWDEKLRETVIVFIRDGMDFVEALTAAEAVL